MELTMKVWFCLALGVLFLLEVDANTEDDDRLRAWCLQKLRTCRVKIPLGMTKIVNNNGELAVTCNTLEAESDCMQNFLQTCDTVMYGLNAPRLTMPLRMKQYLCDNSVAFIAGAACWRAEGLRAAEAQCGICHSQLRACLQDQFQAVDQCSDVEAGLMAGITAILIAPDFCSDD